MKTTQQPTRALIRLITLALLAGAVGSLGCGSVPTTHYYLLEPQDVASSTHGTAGAAGLSIGIAPFQVDAPYDQDRIVYRIDPDAAEVGYYAYHRWAAPLSRMLPRVVAGAYGDLKGVASIEPANGGFDYDATLHGRVVAIEEVDSATGVGVRLVLMLTLVAPDGTDLWTSTLSSPQDVGPAKEVHEVVTRMRGALNALLDTSGSSLADRLPEISRRLSED